MKSYKNMTELQKEELTSINGGHEGLLYKLGIIWMDTNLRILGTLAGIADGFDSGMKN
jgi:hypothetical protein